MSTSSSNVVASVRSHPLASFFVMTMAVSWILWAPILIFHLPFFDESRHVPSIYILPGIAIGATGSAFLMTALIQGKEGVIRLLRRFVLWQVGWQWYAFAVLGLPVLAVLIGFIMPGGQDALLAFSPSALIFYPAAYIAHFYFGPLFEEAAWRGFALPRLQQRYGPLAGTLILGFLWGLWHLPVYLPIEGLEGFAIFILGTIAMSFTFTWVFNNTKGSLIFAILVHGSIDGTVTYLGVLADRQILSAATAANIAEGLGLFGPILLALLLIIITRGRLSYHRYKQDAEPLDLPLPDEQKGASPEITV